MTKAEAHVTRATVYEVDRQLILDDPDALGVSRAVAKHNCRLTMAHDMERIRHFVRRIGELGESPGEVVIVLINVDEPVGKELAEVLMPGHDWGARTREPPGD